MVNDGSNFFGGIYTYIYIYVCVYVYSWQFWMISTEKSRLTNPHTAAPTLNLQNLGRPCREAKGKRFCPCFNGTSSQLSFPVEVERFKPRRSHSWWPNTAFFETLGYPSDVCIIAWATTKTRRESALNLCNKGKWASIAVPAQNLLTYQNWRANGFPVLRVGCGAELPGL